MDRILADRIRAGSFACECGKIHSSSLRELIIEKGALNQIPELVRRCGGHRIFLLADRNTYAAAGETVCAILESAGISFSSYVFPRDQLEPDEFAVGAAVMHYDSACDLILGVGSGVINDIGKILANLTGCTYMIAATAPSMDGYASATSSMARDGMKVSIDSVCPAVIIGDLDVLYAAPANMLQSGLGDMAAKYVSICEWRIAHRLLGEDYCPEIARMVREALRKCAENAEALACREPQAVAAVMEGLAVTGIAMSYAGLSRPASGMEHYMSHLWDMRGLAFGTPTNTHGIQCGIATLLTIRAYEKIRNIVPDRESALTYVTEFDLEKWNQRMTAFLGNGANAMIDIEKREGKYDKKKHAKRLEVILNAWPEILQIIDEEIPSLDDVKALLTAVGAPTEPAQIGISRDEVYESFLIAKDIRDKYVGTRLLWDLGLLETVANQLF